MPHQESDGIQTNQKMQKWIKIAAGIGSGTQVAGLDGDQDEPQDRSYPGLKDVLLRGTQLRLLAELLGGIVRRLARDHNIVHVALP